MILSGDPVGADKALSTGIFDDIVADVRKTRHLQNSIETRQVAKHKLHIFQRGVVLTHEES